MNLKESYRYMNYLNETLLAPAQSYLSKRDFITSTKQEHLRSKASTQAEDETIEVVKPYDVEFDPMNVVDFIMKVIDEKEKLSATIAKAKQTTEIDIDHSVSINKSKQEFINKLNFMLNMKSSEKKSSGIGYVFNAEGNQTSYRYDINEVITIDYNRDDVKGIIKKLSKECDEVSAKLDKIQIETLVDFEPKWELTDSLEDAIVK